MNGYDVDQYGIPKPPRSLLGRKLPTEATAVDQRSRLFIYVGDGLITVLLTVAVLVVCQLLGKVTLSFGGLIPLLCAIWIGVIFAGVLVGEPKVRNHRRDLAEYLAYSHGVQEKENADKESAEKEE